MEQVPKKQLNIPENVAKCLMEAEGLTAEDFSEIALYSFGDAVDNWLEVEENYWIALAFINPITHGYVTVIESV